MVAVTGIPHWDDAGPRWDRVVLGGVVFPGVWQVTGAARRRLDIKDPKGADGGRVKDEGYQPAQVDLYGRILAKDDWATWQKILPQIHPRKKGAQRSPLVISHPALDVMGIKYVYIEEVGIPVLEEQILTQTIKLVEWTDKPKKKKKNKKPKGGEGSVELDDIIPPGALDKLTNVDL